MRKTLLVMSLLLWATPAWAAKSQKTFTYSYDVVWSTLVRLLRADRGYPITDRDKDNGYLLFTYPGTGGVKECPASVEILKIKEEDRVRRVRVQLLIAHQPSYIQVQLLDALERKLIEEQGQEPEAVPEPQKKPPAKKGPGSGGGKR